MEEHAVLRIFIARARTAGEDPTVQFPAVRAGATKAKVEELALRRKIAPVMEIGRGLTVQQRVAPV